MSNPILRTRRAVEEAMSLSANLGELYAHWWTSATDGAARVEATHIGESLPPQVWHVLDQDLRGGLLVSRSSQVAVVAEGEWLTLDEKSVEVRRRRVWETDGFLWRNSKRLMPAMALRWRVRMYVPASAEPIADFTRLADILDQRGIWFQAKTNTSPIRRTDQSVFWLDAADAVPAAKLAGACLADTPLELPPPPLTLCVGPVGLAQDPADGDSLGRRMCGAVASTRDASPTWDAANWQSACDRFDLLADRPWRHVGRADPYRCWVSAEKLAAG
jgi:hypothetical protein